MPTHTADLTGVVVARRHTLARELEAAMTDTARIPPASRSEP